MTARTGATTIGFIGFSVSEYNVESLRATVSLRGLKRSCGSVSQAGNS